MNLLLIAALVAACGAAKLDRTYLPPASARTAGGSPGALQAPNSVSQNSAPKGSYTNDFQGVVVDAALAGTRASGPDETGLGAPRNTYGSTASKVGEAAFRGTPQAGFRYPVTQFGSGQPQFGEARDIPEHSQSFGDSDSQGFGVSRDIPEHSQSFGDSDSQGFGASIDTNDFENSRPERPQAAQERAASTVRFDSEVGAESFNYAYETDNGIFASESGTATNGVQAQGGYSYTGDDGKVYTVTYTADEGGYQPMGEHLPTPPPIPEEILKSLELNARDEANGIVDNGSYDAQKYNAGDYAESDSANGKQNDRPSVNTGNDVFTSSSFINQNNLPFNPNNPVSGDDKAASQFQANNGFKSSANNRPGASNEYLPPFQQNRPQNRPQNPEQVPNAENVAADLSSNQQESTDGSGNFHAHSQHFQQNQHASRPNIQFGSRPNSNNQEVNGFKQSSSSNQFSQIGNRFPSSQSNRQQFGATPVSSPSNNGRNQFAAQASASLGSQHSTSIPDTELTTPLESSSQDAQPSVSSTNTFGFKAQSTNGGQSHFGSPSSYHQTSQAPAQPTMPSFPQSRPQGSHTNNNRPFGGNRNTQSAFSTQAPRHQEQFAQQSAFDQQTIDTKRPQFSQNAVPQTTDNQFSPSTQKPQFAQQSAFDQQTIGKRPLFSPNTVPQTTDNQFSPSTQKPQFAQQSAFDQQTIGKRPQFSQNTVPQTTDNQFSPSTQKPQFAQQPSSQDDSYYYNQPSRAFNTPQSQGPRFSSAPSNQFNRVTQRPFSSQSTQYPKGENYPSTSFPSQNTQLQGSSRYPRPPSFPTQSTPSENKFQSNAVASATNGITQASASSFAAPTSAPGFNRQQSSQSRQQFQQTSFQSNRPSSPKPSKPSFVAQTTAQTQSSRGQSQFEKQNFESAKPLSEQPLQDVKQPKLDDDTTLDATVMNQQYNGEVYEYTKPAEMLPPPENGFGQFGTKMPSTQKPAASRSQFGQSATVQQATSEKFAPQPTQFSQSAKAPENQFGSRPQFSPTTSQSQQSASSFGSKPQFGQISNTQGDLSGAQTQESTEADKPGRQQFNQAPKLQNQFNNQRRPSAHSQGNFATAETNPGQNGRTCCQSGAPVTQQTSFGGRPSQSGGDNSFGSTFQSISAFKPDQSQSVAGKGEVFGGPRAPPSYDETGYHY